MPIPKTHVVTTHDFGTVKVLEFESNEVARDVAYAILNLMRPDHRFLAYAAVGTPMTVLHERVADAKHASRVATTCLHCGKALGPPPREQLDICDSCATQATK